MSFLYLKYFLNYIVVFKKHIYIIKIDWKRNVIELYLNEFVYLHVILLDLWDYLNLGVFFVVKATDLSLFSRGSDI